MKELKMLTEDGLRTRDLSVNTIEDCSLCCYNVIVSEEVPSHLNWF